MDDAELIRRVRAGDHGAFTPLVDRYFDRCTRFALRMLGNAADAEDTVQETFMRAFRALERYEERTLFRSWLFQILVNQCRTAAARRRRREAPLIGVDGLALADERGGAESRVERAELAAVQRALAELAPLLREAFLLRYVEELSYDEMAAVTRARPSALRMRVMRAREMLRERLEEVNG